ncbi:MAG: ribonuclease III [Lachnospiraceae bacterium]|nr:ribonuclease III [Lachnospiraceae bacterium]
MTNRENEVLKLQEVIGYNFNDKKLLIEALSHTSYTNERKLEKHYSYQRLEFLGDAILEAVTSRYLYEKYPTYTEGELTRERAVMVCEETLAKCARSFNLGDYILLGVGEQKNHGNERDSILCDVFESLIGAIYLDGGILDTKEFIVKFLLNTNNRASHDYKSMLQEEVQSWEEPVTIGYELVKTEGPEHMMVFTVKVVLGNREMGIGSGHSKKEAEMKAAHETMHMLKIFHCANEVSCKNQEQEK